MNNQKEKNKLITSDRSFKIKKSTSGISTRRNPYVYIKNATSGITLIALVISIIVMLILAGVTITSIISDEGIITRAQNALLKTQAAEEKERIEMAVTSAKMENWPDLDYDVLVKEIKREFGEEAEIEVKDNEESGTIDYIVKLPNGNSYPFSTNYDVVDVFVYEEDKNSKYDVKISGYRIELAGKIGLRFYFTIPEEKLKSGKETIKLTWEGTTKTIDLKESSVVKETIDGKNYYYVTYYLTVREMADDVTFQAYYDGEKDSKEYVYSIKRFGNEVLKNQNKYGTDAKQQLVRFTKAMLSLGGSFQIYKGYHTDNLANENIEIDNSYVTAEYLKDYYRIKENSDDTTIDSFSLWLEDEIRICVYCRLTDEEAQNLCGVYDGKEFPLLKQVYDADDPTLTHTFKGDYIKITEYDVMHEIYLMDKNTKERYTGYIKYGVFSFCYSVLSKRLDEDNLTDEDIASINVAKNIVVFNEAYKAYIETLDETYMLK